jgi:hemerythrin-like domain-containing protein
MDLSSQCREGGGDVESRFALVRERVVSAHAGLGPRLASGESERAGSVTRRLGLDHRRLDAILAEVKRCLAAGDCARARTRFAEFRGGLERHIAVEEEVLFPPFEQATGTAQAGPTRVMRAEHAELRRLMAEITATLARNGGEGPTTPLAALTARIYAHNGKEERILYPAMDRLGADRFDQAELARRLGDTE